MELKQLTGWRFRLLRELSIAYSTFPWQTGWIERLIRDIAVAESKIAALQPGYEPRIEPSPIAVS